MDSDDFGSGASGQKPRASLSRRDLFEAIWARPVVEVARSLSISDVGLRKLCRRNEIPLPPRGYWQKKRAGQSVKRPKLPYHEHGDASVDSLNFLPRQEPWDWADIERTNQPSTKQGSADNPPPKLVRTPTATGSVAAKPEVMAVSKHASEEHPLFRVADVEGKTDSEPAVPVLRATTAEEIRPFMDFCRHGKLFEVQAWIHDGGPVNPPLPPSGRRLFTPLGIAVDRGFHSLVLVLLQAGAAIEPKGHTGPMARAIELRRLDLVQLLVEHGYDIGSIDMREAFAAWDPEIMTYLIERGAEVEHGNPLAHGLCERVRTALGIFKRYRDQFPSFLEQANIALRFHCKQGDAKWVSLMLWAGADPYAPGPDEPYEKFDPEPGLSAITLTAIYRHFDLFDLKGLVLKPEHSDTRYVFYAACKSGDDQLAERLLAAGVKLNDQPNGGCSTIRQLIEQMACPIRNFRSYGTHYSTMRAIEFLCSRGGRWFPDKKEIAAVRQSLLKVAPENTAELVRTFAKHRACTADTIAELLRTPRIRSHVSKCEDRLKRSFATLKKHGPTIASNGETTGS